MDWYLEGSPGGGIMVACPAMGLVLEPEAEEHLEFLERGDVTGEGRPPSML